MLASYDIFSHAFVSFSDQDYYIIITLNCEIRFRELRTRHVLFSIRELRTRHVLFNIRELRTRHVLFSSNTFPNLKTASLNVTH